MWDLQPLTSPDPLDPLVVDQPDLCDALSSFSPQGRATLDEVSKIMGMPGKPAGMKGSEVASYYRAGQLKEIADYCETDVFNCRRAQPWRRPEHRLCLHHPAGFR